jgi:hypothetical protein
MGNTYADRVDWARRFGYQGRGRYKAVWNLDGNRLASRCAFRPRRKCRRDAHGNATLKRPDSLPGLPRESALQLARGRSTAERAQARGATIQ